MRRIVASFAVSLLAACSASGQIMTYGGSQKGEFFLTIVNTCQNDNVTSALADFSALETNYVAVRMIGAPQYLGGDQIWEFHYQTAAGLGFRPANNLTFNYLQPGESVTFRIQQTTNYHRFGTANGILGTEGSGNMQGTFQAPDYSVPNPVLGEMELTESTVSFSATNLLSNLTYQIQRSLDLTNGWDHVTNLTASGSETNWSEEISNEWQKAYYRVTWEE